MKERVVVDDNIILDTDIYKHIHWELVPKHVAFTVAYMESRGVSDKGLPLETVACMYQYYIERYLIGQVVTKDNVDEAEELINRVLGKHFNVEGWKYILDKYEGRLPIRIKAVAEGTVLPCHNVMLTIENTDPKLPWLTTFIETMLLRSWYPISVATTSFGIRRLIKKYAELTGGNPDIRYHLNDFGSRGVSSKESAGIGGCAHLFVFDGTDNIEGIRYAEAYYKAKFGFLSVPATEHSETLLGGEDHEKETYEFFMDQIPEGILSIVSDTYDLNNAVDKIFGVELRSKILNRNGKLVVRPDSGFPPHITIQVLKSLYKNFGGTINEKGYIVLNPKVGVIYGDYIRYGMIDDILSAMVHEGFSTDNVVFGMGGALLQQVNRDTFKFAIKNSAYANEKMDWTGIAKNPITDPGKKSKKGRLQLILEDGKYTTQEYNYLNQDKDLLKTVFENGESFNKQSFDEVRNRILSFL